MTDEIKTAGVLGAGTMGSGIATVLARAGYRTILYDVQEANLTRGLAAVRGFFDRSAALKKLTASEASAAVGRLAGVTDLSELSACGVVIEAVYEDIALKKDLFARLDDVGDD